MCEFGLNIVSNDRVLVKNGLISANNFQRIDFTSDQYFRKEPRLSTWNIVLSKVEKPDEFIIENTYLEHRPRLICAQQNPALWSPLISSNRRKDEYKKASKCLWKIVDKSGKSLYDGTKFAEPIGSEAPN